MHEHNVFAAMYVKKHATAAGVTDVGTVAGAGADADAAAPFVVRKRSTVEYSASLLKMLSDGVARDFWKSKPRMLKFIEMMGYTKRHVPVATPAITPATVLTPKLSYSLQVPDDNDTIVCVHKNINIPKKIRLLLNHHCILTGSSIVRHLCNSTVGFTDNNDYDLFVDINYSKNVIRSLLAADYRPVDRQELFILDRHGIEVYINFTLDSAGAEYDARVATLASPGANVHYVDVVQVPKRNKYYMSSVILKHVNGCMIHILSDAEERVITNFDISVC
jgi:hypothetical protein